MPRDKAYKIIEEYYEVIVQLLTALIYSDGYKTLSHVALISYLAGNYKVLNERQIELIDRLRKFRHGTVYYGKKVSGEFLMNNESEIKDIIAILIKLIGDKIKEV